jgi:hypothetical protein
MQKYTTERYIAAISNVKHNQIMPIFADYGTIEERK